MLNACFEKKDLKALKKGFMTQAQAVDVREFLKWLGNAEN